MSIKNRALSTFLLLVILSACHNGSPNNNVPVTQESPSSAVIVTEQQFESSNFEIGSIVKRDFATSLEVTGSIHLPEKSKAAVSSLLDGTVGPIDLIKGQLVRKGSELFTITNPELINMQEDYIVLQGRLSYLEAEYNRQSELSTDHITTKRQLLKTKSELGESRAKFYALKKKLNLYGIDTNELTSENLVSTISIKAPISGYISDIGILQGAYLESTRTALEISNTQHIHLELSVLEKDAYLLEKGQVVNYSLQSNTDIRHTAEIYLIDQVIGADHMINVHCHIAEADAKKLIPGMFVNASVVLETRQENALPNSALAKLGDSWYALKLIKRTDSNYSFEQVEVQIGVEQEEYIEVDFEPNDKDQYLVKGTYYLIE